MKERKELKATLLTLGGSLLVWGIQMGLRTQYIEAVGGIAVAAAFLWGYENVCAIVNNEILSEAVSDLDEDMIKQLIDENADRVRDGVEDIEVDSNNTTE